MNRRSFFGRIVGAAVAARIAPSLAATLTPKPTAGGVRITAVRDFTSWEESIIDDPYYKWRLAEGIAALRRSQIGN